MGGLKFTKGRGFNTSSSSLSLLRQQLYKNYAKTMRKQYQCYHPPSRSAVQPTLGPMFCFSPSALSILSGPVPLLNKPNVSKLNSDFDSKVCLDSQSRLDHLFFYIYFWKLQGMSFIILHLPSWTSLSYPPSWSYSDGQKLHS